MGMIGAWAAPTWALITGHLYGECGMHPLAAGSRWKGQLYSGGPGDPRDDAGVRLAEHQVLPEGLSELLSPICKAAVIGHLSQVGHTSVSAGRHRS